MNFVVDGGGFACVFNVSFRLVFGTTRRFLAALVAMRWVVEHQAFVDFRLDAADWDIYETEALSRGFVTGWLWL